MGSFQTRRLVIGPGSTSRGRVRAPLKGADSPRGHEEVGKVRTSGYKVTRTAWGLAGEGADKAWDTRGDEGGGGRIKDGYRGPMTGADNTRAYLVYFIPCILYRICLWGMRCTWIPLALWRERAPTEYKVPPDVCVHVRAGCFLHTIILDGSHLTKVREPPPPRSPPPLPPPPAHTRGVGGGVLRWALEA